MIELLHFCRRASALVLLLAAFNAQAAGPAGLLNDTGQTQCDNGSHVPGPCNVASTGDASSMPGQDGRFGRDVAAPVKMGGGAAGFDFTKVCMNGALGCAGAANTGAVPAATEWACTKDNVTNLIWSLESRLGDWTIYASTTLPADSNAANRCNYNTGWRLPTRRELLSLVLNDGSNPAIDAAYFPATQSSWYWTSDTQAPSPSSAWVVNFHGGDTWGFLKTYSYYARVVRSSGAQAERPTGLLNDTGQTQCDNGRILLGVCNAASTGDASSLPRQDGRFGRDVATPVKVGGGAAGFDFTKVCMNGALNCAGAANTGAVPAANEWACTKDNVTNLIWSLESRMGDWTTSSAALPAASNAANRCNYNTGWRLPTRRELLSIVLFDGSNPSIDTSYFPATQTFYGYWTSEALIVDFRGGYSGGSSGYATNLVRLVRSGP